MKLLKFWILATRPKTLPAAAIPVVIGGALASAGECFVLVPWVLCLSFALLIQIGTNFANDYYDFIKGADDERRIGPDRAVASGWIQPRAMYIGMILTFAVAFAVGCLLIPFGGWWLLIVGGVSIASGIAYTGGPYPLGYNGWGDVFVFIFFGWIATGVTYFVQSGSFVLYLPGSGGVMWTILAGMVPGALATNLLVVNNVRDEPLDRLAGKRTLVVRLGRSFGLIQYGALSLLALMIPLAFAIWGGVAVAALTTLSLPLAIRNYLMLRQAKDREGFEKVLAGTALQLVLLGSLFSLGLLISA